MNNINNKLITKETVENIINKYTGDTKVSINNIKKFQKAFIHKSFCNTPDSDNSDSDNYCAINYNSTLTASNERLEFLGDKVIDLITTEFLFDSYPDKDEGFLTKLKSRLVKKESLSYLGEQLGFKELLLLSSHVERIDGRNNPRFLEDIFESFMGIFYKDQKSNLGICKKFLLGVYATHININDLINVNDNYKDSILRYFHSKGWGNPIYKNIYHIGSVQSREFTTVILLDQSFLNDNLKTKLLKKQEEILTVIKSECNHIEFPNAYKELIESLKECVILGMGKGSTKKITEQMCSKNCLINLGISLNY